MPDLSYALPEEALRTLVPTATTKVIASNVKEWRANKPGQVSGTLMFIWDEMVHRGRAKDPFKIAPIVNRGFRGIYEFVQKELGAAPVTKVHTAAMYLPGNARSFADVSIAKCYPKDIHICDVEFSDYSRPLSGDDPTLEFRGWHGLHVFPEFLQRVKEVARAEGAGRLSLMVAHKPLYDVFKKHGFTVSQTVMAQRAFQMGSGFPMLLEL